MTVHVVQIFLTNYQGTSPAAGDGGSEGELRVLKVPRRGALQLVSARQAHRVAWQFLDGPLRNLPVGWQGSVEESRASFGTDTVDRGDRRRCVHVHPPYSPKAGTIFFEYRLRLPETTPLALTFANAMTGDPGEGTKSDGVTFRVWADGGEGWKKLFERHTKSLVWEDGSVDLSPLAGREILLRFESHPGPDHNTGWDSCYWAEPAISAGAPPVLLTEEAEKALRNQAIAALKSGKGGGEVLYFSLDGGLAAAVAPGPNGLADAAFAFGDGEREVCYRGMRIEVMKELLGRWPSGLLTREVEIQRKESEVAVIHRLSLGDEEFDLTATLRKEGPCLRIAVECPGRITDLALGPEADRHAPRVFFGHGYCVVEPEKFQVRGGGHSLSTSHVGFEFDNGLALLLACDNPPDFLEVDPASRVYTLHTHMNAVLTVLPSKTGAFDAAIRYRPFYDKLPSPGVQRKAGRFVFDIWGGSYREAVETMQQAIDHGLTDSLLLMHVWQRWGYDYRLPDIYPPNPQFGTLADLQELSALCARHDIPWGLHDNYIDLYPDAGGFSYEHVAFDENGRPRKAWINESRDAQSYKWLPDRFMPFLKRNLEWIKADLAPTAYFIDVFTSANCDDNWDRQGNFHSFLETRKWRGESFSWIRDFLGNNAPTVSEAGSDQLIGWLDGADCQHLTLSSEPKRFYLHLASQDWERVPWFDLVNHTRFSQHGAGYSNRYQGDRSRRNHGIESDDYLSDEIMLGHALMMDHAGRRHGAVRKYWLAQAFIRSIAGDEIAGVRFEDGDIHRIRVDWESGATVLVNRSDRDWEVEGRILPPFGFVARNGDIESAVERIGGAIVERSAAPDCLYFNGRGFDSDRRLPVRPSLGEFEYKGGRQFSLSVHWDVTGGIGKDFTVFVHFEEPSETRKEEKLLASGVDPKPGTSGWAGRITTGQNQTVTVPEDFPPGEYDILAGLYDRPSGQRQVLIGDETGDRRYRIGRLRIEGNEKEIASIALGEAPKPVEEPERMNPARKVIDFGPAVTWGAFRLEIKKDKNGNPDAVVLTPSAGDGWVPGHSPGRGIHRSREGNGGRNQSPGPGGKGTAGCAALGGNRSVVSNRARRIRLPHLLADRGLNKSRSRL